MNAVCYINRTLRLHIVQVYYKGKVLSLGFNQILGVNGVTQYLL